jgi:hypothetical protein
LFFWNKIGLCSKIACWSTKLNINSPLIHSVYSKPSTVSKVIWQYKTAVLNTFFFRCDTLEEWRPHSLRDTISWKYQNFNELWKKCRLCVFSSPVYTPYHKPGKYACCSNMKMWLLLCHVASGAMGCYGCKWLSRARAQRLSLYLQVQVWSFGLQRSTLSW